MTATSLAESVYMEKERLRSFAAMLRNVIDDVQLDDEETVADGLARIDAIAFSLDALAEALALHIAGARGPTPDSHDEIGTQSREVLQ